MTLRNAFENLAVESKQDAANAILTAIEAAVEAGSTEAKQDAAIAVLTAIEAALSGTVNVGGTVALDAPTLAALENITATLSGSVALDAPTLAALENIVVSGQVSLDSATLAALETVNAAVTGTVALDAPTLAALENVTATVAGSVAVTGPLTDTELRAARVKVDGGEQLDMFKALITGSRYNQVEVHLDDTNWATYVNETSSGGGTAAQSLGAVSFSTSTGTNGRRAALSLDTIRYRPHAEIYAGWTAAFPTAGVANSWQRIGLMDDLTPTNGLVVGYEGTSFGLTWFRNGTTESHIPQANWNIDPCLGGPDSRFTRDGVPEAMNPAVGQLYRVGAGLFGFAGMTMEVYTPDFEWIPVHQVAYVNTSVDPIFGNFDFKIGVEVRKQAAGATNLTIRSSCWAGGTTIDKDRLSDAISDRSLAQTVRAVIEGKTPGGNYAKVTVNSQGRLQVTNDSVGADGAAAPAGTTMVGGLDASGNLQAAKVDTDGTLSVGGTLLANRFSDTSISTATRVSTIGDNTIITPAAGKRIRLLWIGLSSPDANVAETLVTVKLLGDDAVETRYRWNMPPGGGFSRSQAILGAVDEPLVVNLGNAYAVDVNYTYIEV